jgi:hypothetical protein
VDRRYLVILLFSALCIWYLTSCPSPVSSSFDSQAPQDVANLIAGTGDETVILSWTDPADADLLCIEITWRPDGHVRQIVAPGIESYAIAALMNNIEYTFTVKAVDGSGNCSEGVEVYATPRAQVALGVSGSTALEFLLEEVGVPPSNQAIMVCGSGVTWAAFASEPWVELSAVNGSAPCILTIGVDPALVTPANSTATIELEDQSTGDTITVNIEVEYEELSLTGGDYLVYEMVGGGLPPAGQTANLVGYLIEWSAVPSESWIQLSTDNGTTPSTVEVGIDPTGLGSGIHYGGVEFSGVSGGGTAVLDIELRMEPHRLRVEDPGVAFCSMPTLSRLSRGVRVEENAGVSTSWSASSDQSWLSVTASGTTGGDVILSASPAGLAVDAVHYATVTVSSGDPTIENEETIEVGLWVGSTDANDHDSLALNYPEITADPIRPYVYLHDGGTDIEVYNVYTAGSVATIPNVGSQLGDMEVSTDGSQLFVVDSSNHSVVPVELDTPSVGSAWPLSGSGLLYLAYGRVDNKPLVFASNGAVIDANSGVGLSSGIDGGKALTVSKNGEILCILSGSSPGFVNGFRMSYSELGGGRLIVASLGEGNTGSNPKDVALSQDGSHAYTASGAPYEFRVFDTDTMSLVGTLPANNYPNCMEVGENNLVYGGSSSSYGPLDVWIYDLDGVEQNSYYLTGSGDRIHDRQLAVSGDGLRMIVSSSDPSIQFVTAP